MVFSTWSYNAPAAACKQRGGRQRPRLWPSSGRNFLTAVAGALAASVAATGWRHALACAPPTATSAPPKPCAQPGWAQTSEVQQQPAAQKQRRWRRPLRRQPEGGFRPPHRLRPPGWPPAQPPLRLLPQSAEMMTQGVFLEAAAQGLLPVIPVNGCIFDCFHGQGTAVSSEELALLRSYGCSNALPLQSEADLDITKHMMARAGQVLVVIYYAPWNYKSVQLNKQIDRLSRSKSFRGASFATADINEAGELFASHDVKRVPTLEIYRGHELRKRWVSANRRDLLENLRSELWPATDEPASQPEAAPFEAASF